MFNLVRVYAYPVMPMRIPKAQTESELPQGGNVRLTRGLQEVVSNAFRKITSRELTSVDFELDDDRNHPVRDEVMKIAFGEKRVPKAAASRLADRLGQAMDDRSQPGLLLVTLESNASEKRVCVMLLPREDVVQLDRADEEVLLSLLRDAFSTGSGLRKVARLQGQQAKTQFLSAEVLDLQLLSAQKSVADFWIKAFLKARPRINSKSGSQMLAAALQRAFDASQDEERDGVFALLFRASSGTVAKTSLEKFAKELPERLRPAYLKGLDNDETRKAVFELDRSVVKAGLGRLIVTGRDGVVISAPTRAVGKSVQLLNEDKDRVVTYKGAVARERVVRSAKRIENEDQ